MKNPQKLRSFKLHCCFSKCNEALDPKVIQALPPPPTAVIPTRPQVTSAI